MPSKHLILCWPLFLLSPSPAWVFSNEMALHIRWPKYWSFSFNISPSNEYSGLIFFRIDWFDLLAVQGTLRSLLQHHNSNASVLQCSAFFMVQLSHLYRTTRKKACSPTRITDIWIVHWEVRGAVSLKTASHLSISSERQRRLWLYISFRRLDFNAEVILDQCPSWSVMFII